MHGEYRHLKAQAQVAESLGIPKDNIFLLSSGDVLELDEEKAQVVDRVQTGAILVDGLGVGDVGNIVLRDRQHLAEDGILKNTAIKFLQVRILYPEDLYTSENPKD